MIGRYATNPKITLSYGYFCRRKESRIVNAFDLSEGHRYFATGDLLFDCYDEDNNPVIKMKGGNSHTAFDADSFLIDDGKGKYFIRRDIFDKTYTLVEKKHPVGGIYMSKCVRKTAYDLLEGHLDPEGNCLFDYYNAEGRPVIATLESKAYVGNLDDFLIIGIAGEPYFFPREKFLYLYEFCET